MCQNFKKIKIIKGKYGLDINCVNQCQNQFDGKCTLAAVGQAQQAFSQNIVGIASAEEMDCPYYSLGSSFV